MASKEEKKALRKSKRVEKNLKLRRNENLKRTGQLPIYDDMEEELLDDEVLNELLSKFGFSINHGPPVTGSCSAEDAACSDDAATDNVPSDVDLDSLADLFSRSIKGIGGHKARMMSSRVAKRLKKKQNFIRFKDIIQKKMAEKDAALHEYLESNKTMTREQRNAARNERAASRFAARDAVESGDDDNMCE